MPDSTSSAARELRQGESKELRLLLARYRPLLEDMVKQLGDARLLTKQDHGDLVQETYVDALRGLPNLKAENSRQLIGWLRVLLVNNIRSLRRRYLYSQKRCVNREVSLDASSKLLRTVQNANEQSVEQELEEVEHLHRVKEALEQLPTELRTLLEWRYVDNLSLREIGQRVNRSEDAVRMLINRCCLSLRPVVFGHTSS